MAKFNVNQTKLEKFLNKGRVDNKPIIIPRNKLDIAHKKVSDIKLLLKLSVVLNILLIIYILVK